jgi:hypothetical protein
MLLGERKIAYAFVTPNLRVITGNRGYWVPMKLDVDSTATNADDAMENESPGDGIMEDDLTEERDATPQERADVADDQPQDP